MKYTIGSIILLFVLVLLQLRSLFNSGFFPMHDDTQVARVVVMGKALVNGQFPVRWVSDLGYGYGYPLFNFYGPLPYYIGGSFYALGLTGIDATKVMIVIGVFSASFTAFLLGTTLTGRLGGILLAVSYSFMPYHAVQLFVRGAIGEYWSTIWYPVIIIGLWRIYKKRGGVLWLSAGIAGTVLSHTLSGFFLGIILLCILIWCAFLLFKKHIDSVVLLQFIRAYMFGFGIAAFFWIPSVLEMRYTNVSSQISETANAVQHFVCLPQLWYSPWGFGGSTPTCEDGMSFALGRVFLVTGVLGMIAGFRNLMHQHIRHITYIGVITIGISVFLLLPVSEFLWSSVPGLLYLQYPWRLLSWSMVGLAIVTTLSVYLVQGKLFRAGLVLICSVLIVVTNINKFQPQYIYQKDPSDFESRQELRFRASKVSDEYLPKDIRKPMTVEDLPPDIFPQDSDYTLKPVIETEIYKKYEIQNTKVTTVTLQQAHFPGWVYRVNGKIQQPQIANALATLTIPDGFSTVELRFEDTFVRRMSNVISLIIVVLLVYTYGKKTFR